MNAQTARLRWKRGLCIAAECLCAITLVASAGDPGHCQQTSVSAWDAANFRIWGYVPWWSGEVGTSVVDQLNTFSNAGAYDHVSDVLYIAGVRPTATGDLWYYSEATSVLDTLKSQAAQHDVRVHLSMFDTSGGSVDSVWTSITSNPNYRDNFVNNVTDLLQTYDMKGFNFDWERPNTAEKWGNYTQLARELGDVIRPLGMEVSVCDNGGTDMRWDDTALFDARVYDQLFIMIYHLGGSAVNTFANQKLSLIQQGEEKAFKNEQLTIGVGTWGRDGPRTVRLREFVDANPDLAYDVSSISGTYTAALDGISYTGTWTISSRQQVREKTQVVLDRGMPGMFTWIMHYDALNELGLHRVMHHYAVFQRGVPDLNLDGKVDAADANTLADNMGAEPGRTGTDTAARFDDFYLRGNWEEGDRDGNGLVNQADADWLAGRFATIGVALPDRLAYTGTFEKLQNAKGLAGRWQAVRNGLDQLPETANFIQRNPGFLSFTGSGVGADRFSNASVTIRNQNSSEQDDSLNTAARTMYAQLAAPIDLAQNQETYVTFLVRQNTDTLLAAHLESNNRTLSLELQNSFGQTQYDFSFFGQQTDFGIRSQADAGGQDVAADGFAADATYLFVGKVSGNGAGANRLQASLFPSGATVDNFTDPTFSWMLNADGGAGFNPMITQLQLTSSYEASFTVSNLWVGTAADFFNPPAIGDFNGDGVVNGDDLARWQANAGSGSKTHWHGDANGDELVDGADFLVWQRRVGNVPVATPVPEPASGLLLALAGAITARATRRG